MAKKFLMKKVPRQRWFLRQWRLYRGLNQEQLAERLNMTQTAISKLENNNVAYSQPVLEALADALSCRPADLIMRDPFQNNDLFALIDGLCPEQKEDAFNVLKILSKKTG
jgi:transcriptional regulator with XRE-family HTH domain